MQNPTVGRVSSEWSKNREHPVTGRIQTHAGIDIAAPVGTPIRAAFAGQVLSTRTGSYPGDPRLWRGAKSGNHVRILNTDGAVQYYGHCNTVLVREGQWVEEGQIIATVGQTGVVTGPHLHFECWSNDNINSHFNPRILFERYKLTPGVDNLGDVKPQGNVKPRPPAKPAASKPKPKTYTTVRRGSRNATVGKVQAALYKQGYTKQTRDNVFGAQTEANVRDFQRRTKLFQDGIAGPVTQKKLGL